MSIKKKLSLIEDKIKTLEKNDLNFDEQINLFKLTQNQINDLQLEIESKSSEIKALQNQ